MFKIIQILRTFRRSNLTACQRTWKYALWQFSVIAKLQSLWVFRGGLGAVREHLGVVLGHLVAT